MAKKTVKKASKKASAKKSNSPKKQAKKASGTLGKLKAAATKLVKTALHAKAAAKPALKGKGKAEKPLKAAGGASAGAAELPKAAKGAKGKLSKDQVRGQMLAALEVMKEEEEVILTNADGKHYCKAPDCDMVATTQGYCRLHFIATWKRNKNKLKILSAGILDKYIEELTSRYPDKYVDIMRKDLSSEKDFHSIISEMEMEDQGEEQFEEDSKFIDEVRSTTVPDTAGDDDY